MKHKTKSIISLFMALCLMLSLGVGALAEGTGGNVTVAEGLNDLVVVKPTSSSENTQVTLTIYTDANSDVTRSGAKYRYIDNSLKVTGSNNNNIDLTSSTSTGTEKVFTFTLSENVTVSADFRQYYAITNNASIDGITVGVASEA